MTEILSFSKRQNKTTYATALPAQFILGTPGILETRKKEKFIKFWYFIELVNEDAGMAEWRERSLPPLWPGFDSRTWCHMWVEFVVGSRPHSEGFSPGSPISLSPQKPTLQILTGSGN